MNNQITKNICNTIVDNILLQRQIDFDNGVEFANISNKNSFNLNVVFDLFDIANLKSIDFQNGFKFEKKRLSKKFNEFLKNQ